MACSIARTLDIAGEPWSPLILRDVWVGITRFDDIQRDLAISRKVLAERLSSLVGNGMLERRAYSERPPRHDYLLTAKGYEFCDVLLTITAWGDKWTAGKSGPPVLFRHRACGKITHAEVRCRECGELLRADEVDAEPGPGARPAAAG
jgi:DNA-binding HxlR family transcriptional regulator